MSLEIISSKSLQMGEQVKLKMQKWEKLKEKRRKAI